MAKRSTKKRLKFSNQRGSIRLPFLSKGPKRAKNGQFKSKSLFARLTNRIPHAKFVLPLLLFAIVGSYLVFFSKAATVTLATIEAETMSGATNTSDGLAKALYTTSTIGGSTSFSQTSATQITVRAKGDQCQGAPQMVTKIDGVQVQATSVGSTGWSDYSANINIPVGTHTLEISFINDYSYTHKNYRKSCDRNLYVDKVTLYGTIADPISSPSTSSNLALNKSATASSTESWTTANPPSSAVDGNTGTRFSSDYFDGQWWRVDLGSSLTVNKVVINWETALCSSYNIETSTDGSNFTAAATVGASAAGPTPHSFADRSARFVRITCLARATPWGMSFWEFEVYGGTSTSDPTPTPTPTPPPPSGSTVIFEDQFTSGQIDQTKWNYRGNYCDANLDYACVRDTNTFLDGLGNLVVRTKREPSNYLGGGPYSGGWVDTFGYGTGWPPTKIKAEWAVPYHIEMRAKFPNTAGAWGGGWTMNTDRSTSQNNYELDWSEERMTLPTSYDCHQHTWLNGRDVYPWDCNGSNNVSHMGLNWHVYSADVYTDKVVYKVDGITVGTSYGISGKQGLILNMGIAAPGSWGSAGGHPNPSDPGPWDLLVDYVRVTTL